MHHEHQHVLPVAEREQPRPHRHLHRHVEPGRDLGGQTLRQLVGGHRDRIEVGGGLGGVGDQLHRAGVLVRVPGAQGFVAGDQVVHGGGERRPVEAAGQPDRHRDVVGGRGGVELVDEPHPLLGWGQRDPVGARARGEGDAGATGVVVEDAGGEGPHGGGLEQHPHAGVGAEGGVDAGDDTGGDQRVAAEVEEAVVDGNLLVAEGLGDDVGEGGLGVGGRGAVFAGGRQVGYRQGAAVELADRGERDLVEDDDRGGHHVRGQLPCDVPPQRGGIDVVAGLRQDVGDQGGVAGRGGVPDRHREGDVVVSGEGGVDLAEFDAEAADLDLEVGAAEVFHGAVGAPAHHVAGAVHPLPRRPERVGDEPGRGELGSAVVAAGQAGAGDVELAGDPDGDGSQPFVEDDLVEADGGATDGDGGVRAHVGADAGLDGGLGRAVAVVHVAARRPAVDQFRRAGLPGDDEHAQLVEARGIERREGGGGDERVGDAFLAQDAGEFLAAVDAGRHDDEGGAGAERLGQLEEGRVEARRRQVRDAGPMGDREVFAYFGVEVGQAAVGDDDALGAAGRAGGVDQVCRMVVP
ncbi:hypothetical protein AIIKEEIJ_02289 [Rhodococcus sp. YH1]|nr:hypothetical protein [Rhodococcus sp. YH1]